MGNFSSSLEERFHSYRDKNYPNRDKFLELFTFREFVMLSRFGKFQLDDEFIEITTLYLNRGEDIIGSEIISRILFMNVSNFIIRTHLLFRRSRRKKSRLFRLLNLFNWNESYIAIFNFIDLYETTGLIDFPSLIKNENFNFILDLGWDFEDEIVLVREYILSHGKISLSNRFLRLLREKVLCWFPCRKETKMLLGENKYLFSREVENLPLDTKIDFFFHDLADASEAIRILPFDFAEVLERGIS